MKPLVVALDGLVDNASGDLALLPTYNLDAPSFQVLVYMEEVLHFLQVMLGEVRNVEVFVIVRIVTGHRENLVVGFSPIEHFQNAKRTAVDLTSGKRRLVEVNEDIEWIPVLMQPPWNQAVIARIVHG